MRVRKALIPAAGLGTRFLPATKVVPKELLPIVDRPAMEYIIEELLASGIEEVVFVINPEKRGIYEHFQTGSLVEDTLEKRGQLDRLGRLKDLIDNIRFKRVYQGEAKGLGHAVLCGREAIGDEPFAVVLPDDLVRSKTPCIRQLLEVYDKEKCSVVAIENVPKERVKFYGIVSGPGAETGGTFRVTHVVEKPPVEKALTRWAIIGRYILEPKIFGYLENAKAGASGEIQLTDALAQLVAGNELVAHPFEGVRIDTGQPHGWLEANLVMAMERPEIRSVLRPILKRILEEE
ncbi:MAG: UTP--glucose-1-phosphate uridylyltransferase [Pseudomonadota bacterium]